MLASKTPLKVFNLFQTSIYDQLVLEEYLLRDTQENICLINHGSPPAIVMGISGKADELVHIEEAQNQNIPLIKRFSGGGTVIIDEDTFFITFIFNAKEIAVPCFPEPIYRFSEKIYTEVFKDLPFQLKQNDYVFDTKKFGGNAQYIKKDRWLHHTSFLWDYKKERMALLKHPLKTPEYRKNRPHDEFICRLSDHMPSKEAFLQSIHDTLDNLFEVYRGALPQSTPSRLSTHFI